MLIWGMGVSKSIGIDIGSVSVKVVVVEDGAVVQSSYHRFRGGPFEALARLLNEDYRDLHNQSIPVGLTGIGGKTAQGILRGKFFGEIASIAAGNFNLVPDVRTVIEMGGEDSKLLILDGKRRTVDDFAMNAQCAAGTGSFLDQQAARLRVKIEDEFGELALKSKNPPRIAGRCSVFAKSDMIHLQQVATPDYDIVAGLCFAVARNFKSSIARGKRFDKPIALEGGVAANPGMVRAFTEILDLEPGELIVPEHFNVVGAIGAALLAAEDEDAVAEFEPSRIDDYIKYRTVAQSSRPALTFGSPETKHYDTTNADRPKDIDGLDVFMGIDIGSLSTNVVLIDKDHRVIARRYLMTEGRPIEAVRRGIEEIGTEVGGRINVKAVGATGSGRYLIGDFVGADIVRNEITAQATAAVNIDPTVDTIFEIGGQDSKYVAIDDRAVIDFEMNKACAAGTGSFLQEQAEKLDINIKREFGERALGSSCPVGCGERCTVFMESDLVSHQRSGAGKDDLLAGLAYSIASNYLTRVVQDRRIGDNIFFQGGVAWNKAVVAAFENLTGKSVTVPPHHDVTGAIGAAILAIECLEEPNYQTKFKGWDLHKRRYDVESFACEDCSNQCEIHKVEIEGEDPLYYGARCEKYDIKSADEESLPPDYVKMRQKLLFKRYADPAPKRRKRGRVGLPIALHFFEYYPFWRAFFETAGFTVVRSGLTTGAIAEEALELFQAETCYPIKLVYGHIDSLLQRNLDYIFLPSLIKVSDQNDSDDDGGGYICPYVQSIGSQVRTRFDFAAAGVKFVSATISLSHSVSSLRQKMKALSSEFGLSDKEFNSAVDAGLKAYGDYRKAIRDTGEEAFRNIGDDEKALVVVSRPYNGYDPRLSLELPDKIRTLGFKAIPIDFLPRDEDESEFPYMYWSYGRRILRAADYIRKHPNLFAVYITSFGCGPDSFITHFFRKQMAGKPYLQLELDEHSADAGMITRCEAFIDSLRFYKYMPPVTGFSVARDEFKAFEKIIYIPNMCDHAYALRASFERYGLNAEVLDEPDELTLEYGKKFTSGKECFPCVITTGDIVKKIRSDGFDRKRSVFFMPGATGPCRFGLYSPFHRMVLDDLGYTDVPIYSPNSSDGYDQGFGLDGTDFRKTTWNAMVYIDGLQKLLLRTRPYEQNRGETEKLYYHHIALLDNAVVNDESLTDLARKAAADFAGIRPKHAEDKPLVGLVGEIYLRNNRYSNNQLINKLEKHDLEVRLATFTEWPLYTSHTYRRDSWLNHDWKALLHSNLQIFTQMYHEHKIMNAFDQEIPIPKDMSVNKVMQLASKYLPRDVKGEAILSIGKSIEMVTHGASGVVNCMPFNCMPGTIVSALSGPVSADLGRVPWLNISYEGLRDSGEETRLEAFSEQVKAFARAGAQPAEETFEV